MTGPVHFLTALGQALAAMRFYHQGHPARADAIRSAFRTARELLAWEPGPRFTFILGEPIHNRRRLHDLRDWEWAARLERVGIQRLELTPDLTIEDFERFLFDVTARLAGNTAWQDAGAHAATSTIRYGALEIGDSRSPRPEPIAHIEMDAALSLAEEVEAIGWIHAEVRDQRPVPLAEADAVVRSLALAVHTDGNGDGRLPLVRLRQFDQYAITHACNAAVLTMAFAERLGLQPRYARAIGVSALLHDIGNVRMPPDLLLRPGRLDAAERKAVERHPLEGARILIERERDLGVAAIVSFEHHRWLDGRGYPPRRRPGRTHQASRIVQVCDVFDALCSDRPFRKGLAPEIALTEIEAEAGTHFDRGLVEVFTGMVRASMLQFMPIDPGPPTGAAESCAESA